MNVAKCFEAKGGSMGLIGNFFKGVATQSSVKDGERVAAVYECFGPEERIQARVAAALALAFIIEDGKTQPDSSLELVLKSLFENHYPVGCEVGLLSQFNLRLMQLQKEAHASRSPVNQLIAGGLPAWITSIRATYTVEVLPYARRVWSVLDRVDMAEVLFQTGEISFRMNGNSFGETLDRVGSTNTPSFLVSR
jgi:hypothetical protein